MYRREHQKIYTFYFLGLNVKLSSHTHMYSMLIIPVLLQIQQFLLKLKYHIRGNIGDNNIDETQSIGRLNIDDLIKIYFIHALIYFIHTLIFFYNLHMLVLGMEMHMLVLGLEIHMFNSCICGHHVSKEFWMPLINKEVICVQESGNPYDPYAVAFS